MLIESGRILKVL